MLKDKDRAKPEQILKEYGRRMYNSHVQYFGKNQSSTDNSAYKPTRVKPSRFNVRRALILCATLILAMSLTAIVCSALGLQIFNYRFDFKNGFIVLTNLNDEKGSHFYKPKYIIDNYKLKEVIPLGEETRYYIYANEDAGLEYVIEESTSKDAIVYIDNDNYDVQKETYAGCELLVYRDRTNSRIIAYVEKDDTFMAISGFIELDDILLIIDSLTIDK